MWKLSFTLLVGLLIATAMMALRYERMGLTAQTAQLHDQILKRQHTLWDQQIRIAEQTNPLELHKELQRQGLLMEAPGTTRPTPRSPGDSGSPARETH